MSTEPDSPACPVLRKLVDLLDTPRKLNDKEQRPAFWHKLAEIELDAVLLNASPSTRVLIRVVRETMMFSETVTPQTAKT